VVSEWLALTLVVLATSGVVLLAAVLRQRRAGEDDDPSETPDVIEYMTMMLGVVYAIVLGLAIAGVWEARGAAEDWVRQEAQALHEIDVRAGVYPPDVAEEIRDGVRAYVDHATGTEWEALRESGELTEIGDRLLADLRTVVASREPETVREAEAYQGLVQQAAVVDEARAGRADSAGPAMPLEVWVGLVTGAVVVVGMVFALQIQRSARELVLAGLFSALIAFLLFLIWHFDTPYARALDDATAHFTAFFPDVAAD
jgi:multisubunit Na+/H+ antiporter MnhB subunit